MCYKNHFKEDEKKEKKKKMHRKSERLYFLVRAKKLYGFIILCWCNNGK